MLYLFFNIFSSVFTVFILFLILSCMLCLCDHVDDVPFEGEQEQAYEEENQQLNEEGKWIFPLYMFHFDPNNSMINTLLYCFMHEIDGNPIKDIT